MHNRTDSPQTPALYRSDLRWRTATSGRSRAAAGRSLPGSTATVELLAPNYPAEPGLTAGFSVVAFTDKPATLSVSHRFLLSLGVRPRSRRHSTTPCRSASGSCSGYRCSTITTPGSRAGIPVYLGQARYTGAGVRRAFAEISAISGKRCSPRPPSGRSELYIIGAKPDIVPTTFSATSLNKPANYFYGSSRYINIGSRSRRRRLDPLSATLLDPHAICPRRSPDTDLQAVAVRLNRCVAPQSPARRLARRGCDPEFAPSIRAGRLHECYGRRALEQRVRVRVPQLEICPTGHCGASRRDPIVTGGSRQ